MLLLGIFLRFYVVLHCHLVCDVSSSQACMLGLIHEISFSVIQQVFPFSSFSALRFTLHSNENPRVEHNTPVLPFKQHIASTNYLFSNFAKKDFTNQS